MINVAARIRAAEKYTLSDGVRCQGCGERIYAGDVQEVEYVKTKRGTELFFHRACRGRIWETRIR